MIRFREITLGEARKLGLTTQIAGLEGWPDSEVIITTVPDVEPTAPQTTDEPVMVEPVVETVVAEPVTEQATEPVAEQVSEPVAETEPVSEPAVEPAVDVIAEVK